jgi:hypothetical protein
MTKIRTIGTLALGIALVAGGSEVSALTLGRLRGSALLGQPLDVSVPVQASGDEEPAQTCFEADVFYGDGRQESGQITTSVQPGSSSQTVQVRIRTSTRVDEPVVTVYLKSVCGQKTSKRYVLLADLASEVTPPVALVVPAAPVVPSVPIDKTEVSSGRTSAPRAAVAAKPATKTAPTATVTAPKPQPVRLPKSVSPSGDKARLKLTPLELGPERDPVLRSSNELASAPVEDLQKRVEALAMWRALNASAQDILKEEARMQTLEGDLKRLGDMTAKNRQSLQDVTSRLEQSEAQRYANPLVYAMAVGLMACIAAMVLLWQRLRRAGAGDRPWWGADDDVDAESRLHEELEDEQGPLTEVMTEMGDGTSVSTSIESCPVIAHDPAAVDIDLEMGESVFAPPHVVAPAFKPSQPGDFLPSVAGALRAINSSEMLDVRQQAEFFMTLGQYEDAIGLLEASIRGTTQASPLVYLDLLKVLHTLSRRQDFEHYREEFNRLFTGIVPPYASFHEDGRGLDAYPELSSKLVALWSAKEAVQFMEHCMVRAPGTALNEGLDLEAFRELLMLHAVAQKLHAAGDKVPVPFAVGGAHADQAVSAHVEAKTPLPSITEGGAGSAPMHVDFDLSDHEPADNLIDFEISDYSKDRKPGTP